jgi:hypothetical protein
LDWPLSTPRAGISFTNRNCRESRKNSDTRFKPIYLYAATDSGIFLISGHHCRLKAIKKMRANLLFFGNSPEFNGN